jgi:mannan endo-1,4-beta-mannosidase
LAAKSALVLVVVVFGVAASGIAASSASHSHDTTRSTSHRATATSAQVPPASARSGAQVPATPSTTIPVQAAPATTTPSAEPAPTTTTTPPTPTTTPPAVADTSVIRASGTHLVLDGSIYHFTGVNAYEAATDYGTNAGCGAMLSDAQLNQLFGSLPPNSLVRIAALQGSMATNVTTHAIDWAPLDRVFAAAVAHGQRLVVTIANQSGTCDNGHWEDPSWYDGGFMDVFNDPSNSAGTGLTPLSYWDYLQLLVNRYKDSPALGMWEPMSEPAAGTCPPEDEPTNCGANQTCPNETAAAQALRYFFDTVGGEIHTLDPNHLVESGMLGGGQCGTGGSDFEYVSASPGIDVLSYHDYYGPAGLGGDQWNGIGVRLAQAATLAKPIIAGEMGIEAGTGAGCVSPQVRNSEFASKIQAQSARGASGTLAWDWVPSAQAGCSYDVGPEDPLLQPGGAIG